MQKGATVLITGASGGIGADMEKIFAREGYSLILVARSENKLRELAEQLMASHLIGVKVLVYDLVDAAAPEKIFQQLASEQIKVQGLVNNAGFGEYGFFEEINLQRELQMMQVNMGAVVALSKLFLAQLPKGTSGKILNVASTAAFQPGPLMAVYYATKAFVLSFSGALANELENRNVTVTALCPGPTKTGFADDANLNGSDLFAGSIASSEEVAQAGFKGMMTGDTVVIPGAKNQALAFAVRLAPRNFVTRLVRYMQEKK